MEGVGIVRISLAMLTILTRKSVVTFEGAAEISFVALHAVLYANVEVTFFEVPLDLRLGRLITRDDTCVRYTWN